MICGYCNEEITVQCYGIIPHYEDDKGRFVNRYYHVECRVRMIRGGLNHLKQVCICCGGTQPPDPPEMTRRQAAIAAWNYSRGEEQ